MIESLLLITIGLAGGLAVGGGYVAFLTVLDIIPRLAQLTKTEQLIRYYELAVIIGALWACWSGIRNYSFSFTEWLLIPIGLACGVFIGLLAAALTEVLNVIPILTRRIGLHQRLMLFMLAAILGKIIGSLFQWLYYYE